jgi:hypothetical protein
VIDLLGFVVDLDLPLAGHGYDVGQDLRDADDIGDDPNGGIGAPWILAALFLTLVTGGVLVWLNPSVLVRLRAVAPKALILVVIAAPLIAWTASSRSDETVEDLTVERWEGINGIPELLVSLGDKALNSLETTNGKKVVRVECVDREGQVVLDAEQRWPFIYERGYEYAHTHQQATQEQLQRANRCRVLGARIRLEAAVKGALTR